MARRAWYEGTSDPVDEAVEFQEWFDLIPDPTEPRHLTVRDVEQTLLCRDPLDILIILEELQEDDTL